MGDALGVLNKGTRASLQLIMACCWTIEAFAMAHACAYDAALTDASRAAKLHYRQARGQTIGPPRGPFRLQAYRIFEVPC